MAIISVFFVATNVPSFEKNRGLYIYKWVKLPKSDRFNIFELNTSSYRVFYGLSENHKIIEIEQIKLKL